MADKEPLYLPHHIKIMKVALAIAIIRNKPEGMLGEEYARVLQQRYRDQQTDWKTEASRLERELLRTRQELVSAQLIIETRGSSQHNTKQDLTEELTSSGYASYTQDTETESSCGEPSKGGESYPGPCSHSNDQSDCLRKTIRGYVKFCSSVRAIKSVHGQLTDLTTFDVRANLHDTLLSAMKGLIESLECGLQFTDETLEELFIPAAKSIVDCFQLPLLCRVVPSLTVAAHSLITGLVDHVLHTESCRTVLCSVLVILSSVPGGVLHSTREIVTVIVTATENLKKSLDDISCLDVELMESVCELSIALEEILDHSDYSTLTEEERVCFVKELEHSVRKVLDDYPLFTYSVWRIVSRLNRTNTSL